MNFDDLPTLKERYPDEDRIIRQVRVNGNLTQRDLFAFMPGQRVFVGFDSETVGVVDRAVLCREGVVLYSVEWFHDGSLNRAEFYADDLSPVEGG